MDSAVISALGGHQEDRRAVISALKLEQRRPAGDRSSSVAPSGHSMRAPAPPLLTPPSVDPSVQIHVARCGKDARWCCAACLVLSIDASCRRGASTVRLKLTWGHAATSQGGARSGSSGSIGGAMPAASQASSPVLRQPVTDFSLCWGSASDTTRRGSPSGGNVCPSPEPGADVRPPPEPTSAHRRNQEPTSALHRSQEPTSRPQPEPGADVRPPPEPTSDLRRSPEATSDLYRSLMSTLRRSPTSAG